ncbi:MAG: hypothetical protein CMJ58_28200 [Planctomycetaceae bacterium]|nr:hypothetical protein [Planctomycetaceae bacterium]
MAMRSIFQAASWLALTALVGAPLAFLAGRIESPAMKTWMLVATVAWFVVTPLWMGREQPDESAAAV